MSAELLPMTPRQQLTAGRLPRRLVQLGLGLWWYGASIAFMVQARLGVSPWDVLHQGITRHTSLTFGTVVIIVSVIVLLLWIPLRQWPGMGTVANAVLVGVSADATLAVLPAPGDLPTRVALMVGGILLNGLATALYIGSQFGAGPRDGLMTGLVWRTGWRVHVVMTSLQLCALLVGFVLGGTIGLGTLGYAFGIGPIVHYLLPRVTVRLPRPVDPTQLAAEA